MMVERRWVNNEVTAPSGAFHREQQVAGVAILQAQLRWREGSAHVSQEINLCNLHRVGGSRISDIRKNHAVRGISRAVAERYNAAKRVSIRWQRERAGCNRCPAFGTSVAV